MRTMLVVTSLLFLGACGGGSQGARPPAEPEPPAAEATAPAATSTPIAGEEVVRACQQYAVAKASEGAQEAQAEITKKCRDSLQSMPADDLATIERCASACATAAKVIDCFDLFGSPMFPDCSPDDVDPADGGGQ